jgi:hypothetical protein
MVSFNALAALAPRKEPQGPIGIEAEWSSQPVFDARTS